MNGEGAWASSRGCEGFSVDEMTMTNRSSRVNRGGEDCRGGEGERSHRRVSARCEAALRKVCSGVLMADLIEAEHGRPAP